MITIQLCGEVRVALDGTPHERELPGRLGRAALGYLALNRHRAVTRDELIDALWPQGAPAEARATLNTLLYGVRRTLGPGALAGRQALRLVGDVHVDVEQALEDLERARHGDGEAAAAAVDVLERVLLPGFEAPWLDQRRRELEDERLDALELLARAELAAGSTHRAHAAGRRLVDLAPFRESGYALLMQAQAAQGNVGEALQTFERARTVMRDELGTVPSPQLLAAHERLLGAPSALPAPLERAARRPFVGRAAVLRTLRERFDAGGRRFVFIAGEPGIGKTSLAAALARECSGAAVLYGRCDEEALAPYQPFAEMLPEGFSGDSRFELFEAATAALASRAGDRPLVLVLDDLHWADRPTLQLVRHLARASVPARLLVLGAYRDAELEPPLRELIADLRRERAFEGVTLGGLDAAETASLGVAVEDAERMRALTNGNPLFLCELLAEGEAPVPDGIKDVLLRRVGRLGEGAHALLAFAAVCGQQFTPAVLGADLDVLDAALATGLVVGTERPEQLAFSHALIRQTLYEELSEPRRTHLHRVVAETLEKRGAEPAELAHHYFRAGVREPAIRYARAAAARASEALAWEEEARHLERALEAGPDDDERAELLLELGEARVRFGHAAAREAFAEAAAIARAPGQVARAAIGYGGRYYEAGVVDAELIALLRRALEETDDAELRARALARLAEILHFAGDCEESLARGREAVDLARSHCDDRVLAAALAGRHVSLLHVAHVDERLMLGREILAIADRVRDPLLECQALHARIYDRISAGDLHGARQDRERLSALADSLREPLYVHFAVAWAGSFAQLDGDLETAEALALESYALREQLQTRDAEAVLAAQLFMIRRAQGRVAELEPAVAAAVSQYPALAAWRAALPLVHLAVGDARRARAELEAIVVEPIAPDFFWLTALTLLSDAASALGALEPCARLYRQLAPYAARWVQIGYAAPDGPVARSLGLLARACGDEVLARAHLGHALELCSRAGASGLVARARADLGE